MARTHKSVGYPLKSKHLAGKDVRDCSPEFLSASFAILEGRWKLTILHHLFGHNVSALPAKRFSELEKAIPQISQKMLIQQLRCLEKDGIVQRTVYPEVPPKVEYRLTVIGARLRPTLRAFLDWANLREHHRHSAS